MIACEDEATTSSSGFEQVFAEYNEADGTGTVSLAVSGGSNDFVLGGTATEGEDYDFLGLSDGAVQVSIIDDDVYEPENETITIRMDGVGGNNIAEVSIISDCDYDESEYDTEQWSGEWFALEDYGSSTFGPYHITLVQDERNGVPVNTGDPNRYDFDNFYGSGCHAYMIFNGAAGTVYFPNQSPCGVPLTASTGTFDVCDETLTINLNFDGGPWVYRFSREDNF